ncbi:MAG: HD domain-containing protein [Candidatus Aenigmarchaeota archaeon]|nr:HD domain-containing protein [Candidatus Aenigmarchaeota archaeon]
MNEIVDKVIEFASKHYQKSDGIHGISHAKTTAKFAEVLAKAEGANVENCVMAAWLHDIARKKEWVVETPEENHGVWAARLSRPFLESLGLSGADIGEICTALSEHCLPGKQTTLASKILWDSDKLNHFDKEREKEYLKYLAKEQGTPEKARQTEEKIRAGYIKHFQTKTARELSGQN